MTTHAALDFTPLELLQAYTSERLDRFADHLITTGHHRVATLGSREHVTWLINNIYGFRNIPITAFIERPDRPQEFHDIDAPSGPLTSSIIPLHADAVLITDDRAEQTLHKLALQTLPLGTTIYRLYHRFPIGLETCTPDSTLTSQVEPKPTITPPTTGQAIIREAKPNNQPHTTPA